MRRARFQPADWVVDRSPTGLLCGAAIPGQKTGQRPVPHFPVPHFSVCRRAFTLVEMLVALGVLIVAMAVVTTIFGISAKTAAQAQAIGQIETALNSYVSQLEADLNGIDPSQSVLVIQGRRQPAAHTEELRQAGQFWRALTGDPTVNGMLSYDTRFDNSQAAYPPGATPRDQYSDPRADVLMFYTQRPLESRAPATGAFPPSPINPADQFQAALQRGTKVAPAQIMYGIASYAFGNADASGAYVWPPSANDRHIGTGNTYRISQFPLTDWMLARRQVLIEDVSTGVPMNNGIPSGSAPPLVSVRQTWDRILRNYVALAGDRSRFAADSVAFPLRDWLVFFGPIPVSSPLALWKYTPYPSGLGSPATLVNAVLPNMYADAAAASAYQVATLARNPTPDIQSNQALVALPACAWFQVEFLMPEDPRNSVRTPLSSQRDDMARWVEVPPGETFAFVPDSEANRQMVTSQIDTAGNALANSRLSTFGAVVPQNYLASPTTVNRGNNRNVRLWPYAIRITVRAFDREGKLNEPIIRTVIHRFD